MLKMISLKTSFQGIPLINFPSASFLVNCLSILQFFSFSYLTLLRFLSGFQKYTQKTQA